MLGEMLYGFLDQNRKITDEENKIFYDYLDKINDRLVHFNIQPFYTEIVAWYGLTFYAHPNYLKELEKQAGRELSIPEVYENLFLKFSELRKNLGLNYVDAVRYLENQKIVNTNSQGLAVIRITNNEIIAHNAIQFIEKMSKEFPNDVFFINYHGNALYCPILVKNGLAKPDLKQIESYIKESLSIRILRFLFSILFFKIEIISKEQKKFFRALLSKKEYEWIPIENFVRKFNIESLIGNTSAPYHYSENLKELIRELDEEKKEMPQTSPMYDDLNYFPYEIIKGKYKK